MDVAGLASTERHKAPSTSDFATKYLMAYEDGALDYDEMMFGDKAGRVMQVG